LKVDEKSQQAHRLALLQEFTRPDRDNFSRSKDFFLQLGRVLQDYGDWVDSAYHWSPRPQNAEHACTKAMNHKIGTDPCPPPAVIKAGVKDILELAVRDHGGQGTAAEPVVKAFLPGHGINIPHAYSRSSPYRMTIGETISAVHVMS